MSRGRSIFADIGVPYTALALANAFVDATGEERHEVVALVAYASEQLISDKTPGAWHRLDGRKLLRRFDHLQQREQVSIALRMIGFFHWLWLVGLIRPEHANAVTAELHAAAPVSKFVDELHRNFLSDRADWTRTDGLPN